MAVKVGCFLDLCWDLVTVVISLTDIITDVAVTRELYDEGQYAFCSASVAIFVLAQLTYSFIFTATCKP
jgi:hypothetical protein